MAKNNLHIHNAYDNINVQYTQRGHKSNMLTGDM